MNHVTINSTPYPVYLGMHALSEWGEENNVEASELGDALSKLTLKQGLTLAHTALKDGARKAGKEFSMSYPEVCDMIDEAGPNKISEIITKALPDSMKPGKGGKKTGGK